MSMTTETKRRIKREYTSVRKTFDQFSRPVWTPMLNVGNQHFHVCEPTTQKRAKWFQDRLVDAIGTLLSFERSKNGGAK